MLEQISIENFRCFESASLSLVGRPSALIIGRNGSGKSTVRHVLRIFQEISRSSTRISDWVRATDFSEHGEDLPMRFGMEVVLQERRFEYQIELELPHNGSETQIAKELLLIDGDPIFSRDQSRIDVGGATFELDRHVAALPVVGDRTGEIRMATLHRFLDAMILIAPVPDRMSGLAMDGSARLAEDASNIGSWVNGVTALNPRVHREMDFILESAFLDFDSFEFRPVGPVGKQLFVHFKRAEGTIALEFSRLSDGEKCLFLAATILAVNKVQAPVFCFWDEPDNHIALPDVSHLILRLRKMTNQNGQLVATTHHPSTIRCFSDENTFVFTRKSHMESTTVQTLEDFEIRGDLIEALHHAILD